MNWFLDPFEAGSVAYALLAGLLVSALCAVVGTWVVWRGMEFLAGAMAHGMLPVIAITALLGGNLFLGAAVGAASMALGVTALSQSPRLSRDAGSGLLLAGMLSAGVILMSHSKSFAADLTGFLFGDVLAVRSGDLLILAGVLAVTVLVAVVGHRAFVALSFDQRKAAAMGLRPRTAHFVLCGLLTLAIVASFQVVGTLLVFGLLIAPPATMMLWARRIPAIMCGAVALGALATAIGLLGCWHFDVPAGASITASAVVVFIVGALLSRFRRFRPAVVAQPSAP